MIVEPRSAELYGRETVEVNYCKSLDEMIRRAQFDKVDERITPHNFPVLGYGTYGEIKRFPQVGLLYIPHIANRVPEVSDYERYCTDMQLDFGSFEQLLAYGGGLYTTLASTHIYALGGVVKIQGIDLIPYCYYGGFERILGLVPPHEVKFNIRNMAVLVSIR